LREQQVGDADMRATLAQLAQREDAQAELGPLHIDARSLELAQQPRHRHV